MIIAVASGKGGTGKTTISVALAQSLEKSVQILDCDVEEPNLHIFLNADSNKTKEEIINIKIPRIDAKSCTLCGKCAEICEFNALAVLKDKVMVFDELCHSCGGCTLVCPEKSISEIDMPIGKVTKSKTGDISLISGSLDVGRAMSPPLIRAVKSNIKSNFINIIDCPPGNACPAITAVNGVDYILLVTEATPFGLHDLSLSVDTLRQLDIPFGVIINRCDTGDLGVREYCKEQNIVILLEIKESMDVAKEYSKGNSLLTTMPELKEILKQLVELISRGDV